MTSGSKKRKGSADLVPLLQEALKARHMRLPETSEEIAEAEKEVASETAELAARLRDPMGFLAAPGTLRLRAPVRQGPPDEVEQDLARAAREGGEITKDIEQKMREDRAAAEAAEPDDKE